ncbi:MAG: CinA family nicotinamide mononucleotide deamidase-related protein [Bacteroidales bacterium]|nr:CinA family nicotinamide mononucleotide deamidase-related protein [Bacteroidales bacterium]
MSMTKASICTIGDEILIGQIVDTNSSHISQALGTAGIRVTRMISIGDEHDQIVETLGKELEENDIVVVTGGLGPTKDDITKTALAELSGATGNITDKTQLDIIHQILGARGLDVLDVNLAQASVPDTCEVIPNKLGTAPVMVFRFGKERYSHQPALYSLPGVPFEALGALPDIIDDIKRHKSLTDICHRTIMTFGIAESALARHIQDWEDNLPKEMHLAYLPNLLTGVRLRLSVYGGKASEMQQLIEREIMRLKPMISEWMYSEQDDTLQACIGRILGAKGKTVSVAESCTGGMISELLTSVPGSSAYYLGSVTSYANSVKQNTLGVRKETLEQYGAVSSECVAEMSEGVRLLMGSDFSVATSGIAGPGGGSEDKPAGTVWIGVSSQMGTETFRLRFTGDRKRNIERFAAHALNILRQKILKEANL